MKHPAKFTPIILRYFNEILTCGRVLDPFAGTGAIHTLAHRDLETWGVEIEPEWASMHSRTIIGNALHLPFPNETFDWVATSPTYGNRLADHHKAKDPSLRRSYTHDLGRSLHPANSGTLPFGIPYQRFHELAWREMKRVLKTGGMALINVSDSIRKGQRVPVVDFHRGVLSKPPWILQAEIRIPTPRLRYGANATARVENESILVTMKGLA